MLCMLSAKQRDGFYQALNAIGGSIIYALGFNLLIVPLGLYSGGFMGISQLINAVAVRFGHIQFPEALNMTSILYFAINFPLFYIAYKALGGKFALKSLLIVGVQSIALLIIPIPKTLIIEDTLTACIIGGIVAGTGTGLVLKGRASSGGLDIVGVLFSKKYQDFSVGKVNIIINMFIYGACFLLYNAETVVYSLIFATVSSLAVDKIHIQNINMSVMIFTKEYGISAKIMSELGRGVTNWAGEGAYTEEYENILFVIISKYEVAALKKIVREVDKNAFMIFMEGCSIDGNFEKRL